LLESDSLEPKLLSDLERPEVQANRLLNKYFWKNFGCAVSELDAKFIRYTSRHISARSAHFVGIGLAALMLRMNRDHVTIGVDGSLFRGHFHYCEFVSMCLDKVLPRKLSFNLVLSEDGSGKGTAAVAATAVDKERERKNRFSNTVTMNKCSAITYRVARDTF
ncbi:hypothetical protein Ciccas_011123, partial [Cichlidogyrus casuarinus]